MNKEIKTKWLEALRSGEYKQCHGKLRTSSGYCCLGVLCDVMDIKWHETNHSTFAIIHDGGFEAAIPTKEIIEKAELPHSFRYLSEMNDGFGKNISSHSFSVIADFIEINY